MICGRRCEEGLRDEGDDMNILGGRRLHKRNILYNRVFSCVYILNNMMFIMYNNIAIGGTAGRVWPH